MPDETSAVPDRPKTFRRKKLQAPVKKILSGTPPEEGGKLRVSQ